MFQHGTFWTTQTFHLSGRPSEQMLKHLVGETAGLVVEHAYGADELITIECASDADSQAAHDLLLVLDNQAQVIHTEHHRRLGRR